MSSNVTKLKVVKAVKAVAAPSKSARFQATQRLAATASVAGVALILTVLSLDHLTSGIEQVTGGGTVQSAAMAVGIDLSFIALEIAQVLKLPESTARAVNKYARPAILGTMLASAGLNAFGFGIHATGLMVYPAVALGCAVPALIYALTRVAVALSR